MRAGGVFCYPFFCGFFFLAIAVYFLCAFDCLLSVFSTFSIQSYFTYKKKCMGNLAMLWFNIVVYCQVRRHFLVLYVNHFFCLHLVWVLFNYLCFQIWQSGKSLFISKAHRGFFFYLIFFRFEFYLESSKFSVSSMNSFFNFLILRSWCLYVYISKTIVVMEQIIRDNHAHILQSINDLSVKVLFF